MERDGKRVQMDKATSIAAEKSNETLFKSTDRDLMKEYVAWWQDALSGLLEAYSMVELDGTEDSLKCRMIAAARISQMCLCCFQFFGSAVEVIQHGEFDAEANNAAVRVTSMVAGDHIEEWLNRAKRNLN